MGLDMYAFGRRPEHTTGDAPCRKPTNDVDETARLDLAYWRKHPNLHGWMGQLWGAKYPAEAATEHFNCVPIEITLEDLDQLEQAVLNQGLPNTTGFFFGASHPDDKEDDLKFIAAAREAIANGWVVFYDSWW